MSTWLLGIDTDPVSITDTSNNGSPWWVIAVVALVSVAGGVLGTWATTRRDRHSNEQIMIDQLQEETKSLRNGLTELTAEVRLLRVREIAWITHTSTLTQLVAMAGQAVPPLPEELRGPVRAMHEEG
jgi:membrane protein YqaA with SNARE-associated domain